ncbi:MAG: 5-formyltetrahydrofolate cyclo-ligase [Phycisphaerae bacterium]|nr:5-formyltetrahydrofolate cyclo-ligase [Phycisphaerae bacterium]
MDKDALRHELKTKLMQMSGGDRVKKSKVICEHIIGSDVFRQAAVVMAYLSLPHEVDTTPVILYAWQCGKTVAVPKVSWEQRHMIPVEIKSLETGLKADDKGLRNPVNGTPVPFEEIDLVLTPGLGFDEQGNRLGRGGAYYDRFFVAHKITAARWGLAFSEQLCDTIPHDDDDVPVDAVVTEQGIRICSEKSCKHGGK